MRFLETLLIVFVAIYLAQLLIAALLVATLILFLCCLYARPREALALGFGVLLVALISKPIGLVLLLAVGVGFGLWALLRWSRARFARQRNHPRRLLPPPAG